FLKLARGHRYPYTDCIPLSVSPSEQKRANQLVLTAHRDPRGPDLVQYPLNPRTQPEAKQREGWSGEAGDRRMATERNHVVFTVPTSGWLWLLTAALPFMIGWLKGINLLLILSYLMLLLWGMNFVLAGRGLH